MTHALFGTKHLILILCSFALIAIGTIFSRKLKLQTISKTLFGIGIVSETIKVLYYIIQHEDKLGGYLPKTDLPFHLCSIQIIFIAIVALSQSEKLKRFIISFMIPSCLFGGIAAILIATDSSRNGSFVITGQYFLYHVAIVIFSLYLLVSKEFKITVKDYFNCLKFIGVLFFAAIYINSIIYDGESNINFMYVVSPPQKGLPFLNENHGWLVYMVHYASTVLFFITLTYIKPIVLAIKGLFAKTKVKAS